MDCMDDMDAMDRPGRAFFCDAALRAFVRLAILWTSYTNEFEGVGTMHYTRRHFLSQVAMAAGVSACGDLYAASARKTDKNAEKKTRPKAATEAFPELLGNRFFTFNTVVRVNQIEATRDRSIGADEALVHTPEAAQQFRDAFAKGWPGGRMTWAFSWQALEDGRENYKAIRKLAVEFHKKYGDEITFIPGGYFANMYNTRAQVNQDIHEALRKVSEMVGDGYRPLSILAGFLSADNQRYLAEREGIHVCQGNIWSQYAVDNGDGEGSISYPYYPSKQHFCKPAQGKDDFFDCVNLDGWTCDFVTARRSGSGKGFNSRMGLGPIETFYNLGAENGMKELMATMAAHFDTGFDLNKFAWATTCWELSLVGTPLIQKKETHLASLTKWLQTIRERWPKALSVTQGEFGLVWRQQYQGNAKVDYRFVQRGSGINGSDENLEVRWSMNKDFRLALIRDWKADGPETVLDFTRYDLPAEEPKDLGRNWSLMNSINQKGTRK
jgi:hypothetical protein